MNNQDKKTDIDELREFLAEMKKRPKTTTPMLITRKEYEHRERMGLSSEGYSIFEDFVDRNKKHCPQTAAAVRRSRKDDYGSV